MSASADEAYLVDLNQRVLLEAESGELPLPAAFTDYMRGILTDAGEIEDGETAFYLKNGSRPIAASGYAVSDDQAIVDIFATDYRPSSEIRTIGRSDLGVYFNKIHRFVDACTHGLADALEDSSAAWAMARRLQEVLPSAERLRLTLLTNARVKPHPGPATLEGHLSVSHHVWDLDRLYRLESSGREREPITIDLREVADGPIPVLGPEGLAGDYEAYLLLIPGNVLADIYQVHGARLLELNVRSFLQARGKVNKGIQQTIREEPHRFLAYNNGISMTASSVVLEDLAAGGVGVSIIHDLQIVNGGQTTASLYHARANVKRGQTVDLSVIQVQAKLSVVPDERLSELVPKISEYANSQNTIRTADFSANDPFHIAVEKLSRTIWAPNPEGSQHVSRWFYERARGQYADAIAHERTSAKQREFKELHPLGQKFTKTDLSKFELTWSQRPDLVSLGAERCFREFMLRMNDKPDFVPDVTYFEQLIAKAIIFRRAEKIIGALTLGGYRAQTVTYTIALMSKKSGQQLDLRRVWKTQDLDERWVSSVEHVGKLVHDRLLRSAGTSNVSEWAKKDVAWQQIQSIDWLPDEMLLAKGRQRGSLDLDEKWTESAKEAALRVMQVRATGWQALLEWGVKTKNLDATQRRNAGRVRDMQLKGAQPTPSLMLAGAEILTVADEAGFAGY